MSASDVSELLAALRAGDLSLESVADAFRRRSWVRTKSTPSSYAELSAATLEDPTANVPGSFDEVTAAYDRGELTRDQYRTLAHAVAEAIKAEARREAE
jgi:predicted RNA-binding protein associated with RNAse of E/G family